MIRHIVLWKLYEQANNNTKQENAQQAKQVLEALNGKIQGLIKLEVGIDLLHSEQSADIALYSEFASLDDLEHYQHHPEHVKIIPFMKSICAERRVIDFES
ncbi:MAG: Dabb family protein [Gammaproteobacteria bacterium]|nr:Dabb family protein [Gammaproteobacteria bacterium]